MNIKVTMSKLQEIIKEELDMIDVTDDIIEEGAVNEVLPALAGAAVRGAAMGAGSAAMNKALGKRDDDKAFRAFTSVMDYLREDVFPKLSETELYDFGYEMHKFFKTYER